MEKIIIVGNKQFAELAYYQFCSEPNYEVLAFAVDRAYLDNTVFLGLPVIAYEALQSNFDMQDVSLFIAIGIAQCNRLREQKFNQVKQDGYRLTSFISSKASVLGPLTVGENVMIMEGCYLHPRVSIEDNVVVWTGTRIAMHSTVAKHCWVTSAVIGERCHIGNNTFIGLNATINPNIRVAEFNVIDAGTVIGHDTLPKQVYRGFRSKPSKIDSDKVFSRDLLN